MPGASLDVRFRDQSGHDVLVLSFPLLTQSGQMSDRNPAVQQRRICYCSGGMTAAIGPYSESEAYRYLAAVKTIAKPFTRHRIIVVDPGDRRQLRQVRCIR